MKGFTLIELLIVIAIIGILIGTIITKLTGACEKGCGDIKPIVTKQEHERIKCEQIAMVRKVENLPAACVKYYTK